MLNHFCKKPLWECTQTLAAVAQGRQPADTVITGARLVNVCTAEVQDDIDVAIAEGRIAYVGQSAAHCIGEGTRDAGRLVAGALHATAALPSARPCFPHLPYPRQRRGACLRSAMGAPLRLRRGRRGERIGTFPRRFRGRDQVGWPWFEVETGPDGRAQSIAARQLLVA